MRSRVVLATIVLAALVALLAIATCGDRRVVEPAFRGTPSLEAGDHVVSESAPGADRPHGWTAARTPVQRTPRARAAPEPVPPVLEESWFHEPVADWETSKQIDLAGPPSGALVAKWIDMADSGIELERRSDDKALWRVHVAPLGIAHSKYHQEVTVRVEGDRVVVESVGAQKIVEVRDLATGAQTSRAVTDVVR